MSIVATRYGQFRIIDTDNVISHSLKEYGEWAQQEIDFLLHFIKLGASVADVGAFIGTHSRAFSGAVGAGGVVYAFEPRNEIVEVLLENVELSPIRNIKVFKCGLGDRHGEIEIAKALRNPENNFGSFSLNALHKLTDDGTGIQLRTLDELSIAHLDFIKIDVEGMEIEVLLGGDATISRDRPVVFAEVNSLQGGVPLLQWCASHQYLMFCTLHPAYNQKNFAGNLVNCFANALEVGALLVPQEEMSTYVDWIHSQRLIPTRSPDDIALVLLHKPQYVVEVLKNSASASVLKVNFLQRNEQADSALISISQRLVDTERAKDYAERLALDRLAELDSLHQRLAAFEQAKNTAERMAISQQTELGNLRQQMETIEASVLWRIAEKLGLVPGITGKIPR